MAQKTPKKTLKKTSKKTAQKAAKKSSARTTISIDEDFVSLSDDVIDITPITTAKGEPSENRGPSIPTLPPPNPEKKAPLVVSRPTDKSIVSQDPLITYLNEIRKYPLLTPQEEHELAVLYKEKGDKAAAEKLVTSNLRFVVKVAAEYSRFGAKMIDLIQEGNVGLMHAVKEFNPYRGVKLITYAVWWIKGYIREYLLRQHSMVRIGTTQAQKKLFYNLQQESRKLETLGEDAAVELLSERLGVSEKDIKEMKQRLSGRDVSLDQPIDGDSGASLLSFRKDESINPEEKLIQFERTEMLKEKVNQILPLLNEKEKFILEARLLADEPLTLQEIGDKYKITRERARQLENRVIERIRAAFEEKAEDEK